MKLTSENLNLTVNNVSSVLLNIAVIAFIYSLSPLYAKIILGLSAIGYVSKVLYLNEAVKREEAELQQLLKNLQQAPQNVTELAEYKNDQNKTH